MNEGAKVIRLDVNVETRHRPSSRRKPDVPVQPTPVTALSDHRPGMPTQPPKSLSETLRDALGKQIESTAEFARRRLTGDYQIDEFGYDKHLLESVILPALRPLSDYWFRVEVSGIENIPATGGALLVANHAGTVPLDGLMLQLAVHDKHPAHRALRLLAADLVFELPVFGALARKAGHTLACHPDAERLLRSGHIAGVFPEGFKGVGKNYADRYKLQRFGRGGFVSAAVRTGVPIIPVSIVGSEEIYPKLADIKPLARLLGLPYFPVTPLFPHLGLLGAIPVPSKWYIEFGEPIATTAFEPEEADDPMTMFEVTDQVRETIQQTLYKLLAKRRNPVLG
ncbi:lysophospholipid acyltransferase family protein [Nocardia ignorata]|uniref:1-acyl-sn-glycerol-3-phosphate acyltransferase n=2 Tax=Actinomycetes TaxID=1760 RepID=A0A4R6PV90_NOCIG|nr:lysophospholipid acyltransferase family protein [Nocardia ignorata]TDP42788.1 1-acyl-sn-glycerol-3-phosphate acyltransferase [Nocardia ignorata]